MNKTSYNMDNIKMRPYCVKNGIVYDTEGNVVDKVLFEPYKIKVKN